MQNIWKYSVSSFAEPNFRLSVVHGRVQSYKINPNPVRRVLSTVRGFNAICSIDPLLSRIIQLKWTFSPKGEKYYKIILP